MKFIHVGVGGFGRNWVQVLKENSDAEVVGLVDIEEDTLKRACRTGGHTSDICFRSLEEALNNVQADAVVSSTPPAIHEHDVITAMKAGLDVISEKPMADTMASCNTMLKTAMETGRTYAVSQNYRYSSPMWTLADVVRSANLGAVGQVKLDFFSGTDFGGGFRHEMDFPVIIDMSIHHFDLIRSVTGLDALKVSGSAWNPPWSNYRGDCSSTVLFEMNNGARVLYNASWCAKGTFCDSNGNWQIECEKGTVTYRNGEIRVYHVPKLYKTVKTEILPHSEPPLKGQAYVLDEFIRCLKAGKQPQTSAQDNILSAAMVFGAVRAMETGQNIDVLDKNIRQLLNRE